jgi:hypothetical protein
VAEKKRSSSSKKSNQQQQPETVRGSQQEGANEESTRPGDEEIAQKQESELEIERRERRERLGHHIPGTPLE